MTRLCEAQIIGNKYCILYFCRDPYRRRPYLFRKAIFIFISNTGGDEIMTEYLSLKKPREEMKFADFDTILRKSSYGTGDARLEAHPTNRGLNYPFRSQED